jgi:beta-lactamase regulating signal transducer with metallopeptidase domain/parvulin-like peptidyl-prolyl isomerase
MISSLLLAFGNGFAQLAPAVEALGWTLLHFVWQAAALGLALACFLAVGRRASASVRYLAGCSALALMALAATGTFAWQMAATDARPAPPILVSQERTHEEQPPLGTAIRERLPAPPLATSTEAGSIPSDNPLIKTGTPAGSVVPTTPQGPTVAIVDLSQSSDPRPEIAGNFDNSSRTGASIAQVWASREKLLRALQQWLPWIVGLWTCGVGLLVLRLAVGWGMVRRLRREGEAPKDPAWSARLERLRVRLGVSPPVRLLCSASASVPMVIGWLRPVVLVPAGLLAGLTASQLEAILAHELAHIRRHDYLVNLLQNVIETVFFYHPAVWWISCQIRTEREHCCDDLAAAICRSPLDYARALTALAELRHTSGVFGLAATGGSLVNRIARLAGVGSPEPRLGWPFPLFVLTSAAAIGLFATNAATHSGEATKPAAPEKKLATQSFRGQVLDPAGKPVAGATVWLVGPNGRGYWFEGTAILAEGRSSKDGHYDLSLDGPALERLAALPRHDIEVWVRKPGLALAFRPAHDALDHPIEIRLRPQAPRSLRLRNADGLACGNALVAPATAHYGDDGYVNIPDVIANELAVRSRADGRVELTGLADDELTGVRVESAELGVQRGEFRSWEWPSAATIEVTLRKTGTVEGRLVAPRECKANFAEAVVYMITIDDHQEWPAWREHVAIHPDRDGRFRANRVPSGSIQFVVVVPDDWNYRAEKPQIVEDADGKKIRLLPGGKLNFDLSLAQWVHVSRTVRDAHTRQPLPNVEVVLWTELSGGGTHVRKKTDEKGRFNAWILPNVYYHSAVTLPRGYVRENPAADRQVVVDAGTRERELEPIELIRERRVEGIVIDPSDRPVGDVWVGANFRTTQLTEPAQELPERRSVQLQRRPSRFRRIRIRSRIGNDFNMSSRPSTNRTPPGQVTTLTGGVTVLIEGLDQRVGGKPVGTSELSADRIVIWSRDELAGSAGREEGIVQSEDEPFDVEMEGHVVIFQADPTNPQLMRRVAANSATFDTRGKKALLRSDPQWKGSSNEPGTRAVAGVPAQKWAKTDSLGHFHFDDLPCDVELTFTPVHAGIRLAEPVPVAPTNAKQLQLRIGHFDFASIAGRVVDQGGRPVSGAQVLVQRMQSGQTIDCLRLRTGPGGRYVSPAWFPQAFEYRVAVRSMCKDVAVTAARTVANSCEQFPDLVIDRPPLYPTSKLTGTEVVAIVNGEPIVASEIFERWCQEPLEPAHMSLLVAKQEMQRGLLPEDEYRELQDNALREFLREAINSRLMVQALQEILGKDKQRLVDAQIAFRFAEYLPRLKKDYGRATTSELEQRLGRQGTSIASLRKEHRLRLLADEYLRQQNRALEVGAEELANFYREHPGDYTFPERVRWQLLRVGFAQRGGREQARAIARQAVAALERGDDFGSVVHKYSDGPPPPEGDALSWTKLDSPQNKELATAIRVIATGDILPVFGVPEWALVKLAPSTRFEVVSDGIGKLKVRQPVTPPEPQEVIAVGAENLRKREKYDQASRKYFDEGGMQPWTNPASIVDPRLATALAQLAPGETSPIIEGTDSFFIVRLIEHRPAGRNSLSEVENSISRKFRFLKKEQMLEELFERATIESPYLPERKPNTTAATYWAHPPGTPIWPDLPHPSGIDSYNPIPFDFPEKAAHRNAS